MPHCQICLQPLDAHDPKCPVLRSLRYPLASGPVVDEERYQSWKNRYGFRLLEDANIRAAYQDALDEGWVQGRQI